MTRKPAGTVHDKFERNQTPWKTVESKGGTYAQLE